MWLRSIMYCRSHSSSFKIVVQLPHLKSVRNVISPSQLSLIGRKIMSSLGKKQKLQNCQIQNVYRRQTRNINHKVRSRSEGETATPLQLIVAKQEPGQCCEFHFNMKARNLNFEMGNIPIKEEIVRKKSLCEEGKTSLGHSQSCSSWLAVIVTTDRANGCVVTI